MKKLVCITIVLLSCSVFGTTPEEAYQLGYTMGRLQGEALGTITTMKSFYNEIIWDLKHQNDSLKTVIKTLETKKE